MDTRRGDPMGDDEGLLSGLPKTRPGVQTRRRAEAREAGAAAPKGATEGDPRAVDPADPAAPGPGRPSVTTAAGDLARVSAEAAAGTAVAGVRLASRVADGLGKALLRR